jgi:hypothetical protein
MGCNSESGTGCSDRDRVPREKQIAPIFGISYTSYVNWQVKVIIKKIHELDKKVETLL